MKKRVSKIFFLIVPLAVFFILFPKTSFADPPLPPKELCLTMKMGSCCCVTSGLCVPWDKVSNCAGRIVAAYCSQIPECQGVTPTQAILPEEKNKETPIKVPVLSIPIPGLVLTSDESKIKICTECKDATVVDPADCPKDQCTDWALSVPWIGEYIGAFYKWAVGALAILAVIMIMISGIRWLIAGGSSEKISSAKQSMVAAVSGLIFILIVHQVLAMINPELTILKPIVIGVIKRSEFQIMESDAEEGTVNPSSGDGLGSSVSATCFPVASNSFNHVSWNWGSKRSDGKRCHAGVDIFTKGTGEVLAVADGKVIANFFFYKCSGGNSDAVLIDHGSFVALYGEINSGTEKVKAGSNIKAGELLGNATNCGMLHFEIYSKGATINYRWSPPSGKTVGSEANYCRNNYLSTKPSLLLDPTETIKNLQGKNCQ